MSTTITIQNTVIQFPGVGESPQWADPIIQFATAVQDALAQAVGPFDVSPQTFVIDSYNPGTNINLPNLTFSTSNVEAAFIRYTVYRNTSTSTAYEAGELRIVYSPNNPTNGKWEVTRTAVGNGLINFTVLDTGQVQFSTTALSGLSHAGFVTYLAQSLLQE